MPRGVEACVAFKGQNILIMPEKDKRWHRRPPDLAVTATSSDHSFTMPSSALQKCGDDEERHLRRLATYRKYRRNLRSNIEKCREKSRQRMARLRATQTEAQREKHRDSQRKYRERYAEQIAHRARRAAAKKNAEEGKETIRRPKARHYYSDPDQASDEEDEEDNDDW
ncbi:hypothetical protein B0H13DRAFT_1867224 [Mycena leptocephala]|nr:hypothetical protein B0H13DRAFT_1867224 [Mycena leptocephala]